jgi:ribitol-5-phosphate 2-dehydrogenase
MLKQVIRLATPGFFKTYFMSEDWGGQSVVVRPKFLSICAADQRYFTGARPPEIMRKKLPLALLHEAVGEVLSDPSGELQTSDLVAMIPCAENGGGGIAANYRENGKFHSSNCDGFAQEFLCLPNAQLVKLPEGEERIWVFMELASVCAHAIRRWRGLRKAGGSHVGVWGDGSLGFVQALMLRELEPNIRISVFGKHREHLALFSFADEVINIFDPFSRRVDHAFECVGGSNAGASIADIIDRIRPQGVVMLLGVSENPPSVSTRMVLEKGITLVGCSRSAREDFCMALDALARPAISKALGRIVSYESTVTDCASLHKSFVEDGKRPFKTIMEWKV